MPIAFTDSFPPISGPTLFPSVLCWFCRIRTRRSRTTNILDRSMIEVMVLFGLVPVDSKQASKHVQIHPRCTTYWTTMMMMLDELDNSINCMSAHGTRCIAQRALTAPSPTPACSAGGYSSSSWSGGMEGEASGDSIVTMEQKIREMQKSQPLFMLQVT